MTACTICEDEVVDGRTICTECTTEAANEYIEESVATTYFGEGWQSTVDDGLVVFTYHVGCFAALEAVPTDEGYEVGCFGVSLPMRVAISFSAVSAHPDGLDFVAALNETTDHEITHALGEDDRTGADEETAERFRLAGSWARRE